MIITGIPFAAAALRPVKKKTREITVKYGNLYGMDDVCDIGFFFSRNWLWMD
ncbi:MAG: hypothetical protein LIO80_07180 [Lachnospiraceae bacterium]|nr:hypothetical protein [Lachnospiraceae bacterium]